MENELLKYKPDIQLYVGGEIDNELSVTVYKLALDFWTYVVFAVDVLKNLLKLVIFHYK